AAVTINGTPFQYPIPYRYVVHEGENVLTIVTSHTTTTTGANPVTTTHTSTFTLTINAVPLWDDYWKEEIEPGVWRIQDASGFVTNDDMYLFVGEDKAMLFDTGMGEGNLRGFVDDIIGDAQLPIEVVITHAHGDHYGKVTQFSDCKVYWPEKDSPAIPATYDVSRYVYTRDGDTITGPKFDGTAISFECIEVVGHTIGSIVYLYDNLDQHKLTNSYLVTGDAVSSGSYVFNFGSNKPPVTSFLRDLKKLEGKISKFTEGFYDPARNVSFDDVSGHSWQETAAMQPIYGSTWNAPSPLQRLAGIQMVRDMRIAAENVVSGNMKGKLYTRTSGNVVEELRQLEYRQAGFWYNGWDVVPAAASLEYLEVFSTAQNRGLARPNFNAYTIDYTASVKKGETLRVWAAAVNPAATVKINGTTVTGRQEVTVNSASLADIVVEVTEGDSVRTYTVKLQSVGLGVVDTANGAVVGVNAYGIGSAVSTTYKGIPYAAPPVGANRWKPPQPVTSWSELRICNEYQAMSPQVLSTADHWGPEFYYDFNFNEANMSEDCLYLNVTTAATDASVASDKRAVFVWFHGGASMHGYSYEPEFSPEELAKKDIVVVTVGYRLGVFGFFVSDDLAAEQGGTSGNYGFLDQIAALKWVRENIAKFGGDPSNVTIGGQSAGAGFVTQHLVSDQSKGLFKRAIIESSLNAFGTAASYESKITSANSWLAEKGFDSLTLAQLRALPTSAFFTYGVDRADGAPNKVGYYSKGFGLAHGDAHPWRGDGGKDIRSDNRRRVGRHAPQSHHAAGGRPGCGAAE
ncbi:MAG: carboxylesterase family protein, partial [Oscillospiraceae bacterium]|nr:carboxylesterase family protein [Oscillospiraceae bacterium]